ncbi:MAG: cytochrome c3 family protein [Myxococcota bacterium]
MKSARPSLPTWLVALACVLAAAFSLVGRAPAAPGERSRAVRGLGALPHGRALPEADRPPGSEPDDGGPSLAIFPEQSLTIRFNHQKHVSELKLPCTACHDGAKTSQKSGDNLLPPGTRCDSCHASDHRDLRHVGNDPAELTSQCAYCHLGYHPGDGNRVERLVMPVANLKFSHQAHASRNIACSTCHGAVERAELATRDQMPRMKGCISCHSLGAELPHRPSGECSTCHLTDGPRMRTRFAGNQLLPPRWLKDASHGPDWVVRHRAVAGDDSQFCANCHSEKDCADCHDGRVRPRRAHPNDFLSMHAEAARQNSPRCTSCHQQQSFCLACHQRVGVAESGPVGNFAERGRFHPPPAIWTNPPRSSRHHAWEAERNLNACVSCHVERDCIACHASRSIGGVGGLPAGGRGGNPHPLGFRSRCGHALRQNARPCLMCHEPADPVFAECR